MKSKEYEKRDKIVNEERVNVKLPKLVITKFDGTSLDWFRFWNQFESEIDKAEIGSVSKFSYLKELLIPRVRLLIDGLPFTSEGYSRAKSILLGKFGKSIENGAVHIQCLNCYSKFISKPDTWFLWKVSDKRSGPWDHEQAEEINGYVRLTLDKLPGLHAELQ